MAENESFINRPLRYAARVHSTHGGFGKGVLSEVPGRKRGIEHIGWDAQGKAQHLRIPFQRMLCEWHAAILPAGTCHGGAGGMSGV